MSLLLGQLSVETLVKGRDLLEQLPHMRVVVS